ncbi:hypothetical protein [Nocardia sp. A7]|uniref:hypothetical protein n=1 Tax=Nocardia sp. A7 TaxID=2789274 RepID=UPI00397D36D8
MSKYLYWIGAALLGVASLFVGLVPLRNSWPGWAFVAVGIIAVIAVILMFPWKTSNGTRRLVGTSGSQTQKAGEHSRQIQAKRDVKINGGMGDSQSQ